jgi:hypothetical protein
MKISDLGGSMSEVAELKMDELTVLKKEEVDEDVVDKKERRLQIMLEEEDMLQKNVRRIEGC